MTKVDTIILLVLLLALNISLISFLLVLMINMYFRNRREIQKRKKREAELEAELKIREKRIGDIVKSDNERFNYLNSVFTAMANGIVLVKSTGKPVFLNHVGRKFLKVDKSVFFEKNLAGKKDFYRRVIRHCIKTYDTRQAETFDHQEEGKTYRITCIPVYDRYERKRCLGVMADITDLTSLKQMEEARQEFVANVSHEFRTPMTLIAGYVETLAMWEDLDRENKKKCLEVISYETKRLERLVQELLDLSRLDQSPGQDKNLSYVDIKGVVNKIFWSLSGLADERQISLESDIKTKPDVLKSNEQFFYQMLFNLVENGIIYNREKGYVRVSAWNDDSHIYIKVKDNGLGMNENEHTRIFERFYRIEKDRNSKHGGNGIGLSIVDMAVRRMDGKISLESEIQKGSEFTISIPLQAIK